MQQTIGGQATHAMFAMPSHDELARQLFVQSLMKETGTKLTPGNREVFAHKAAPAFARETGRTPETVSDVRKAMMREPFTQLWSAVKRNAKEMQYELVGPSVERQLPELIARANRFRESNKKRGSLMLDPAIKAPRYNTEIEIYCKPGGYHTDLTEDDVFAGAEFDRTFFMIVDGGFGPDNDDIGASLAAWFKATYPDLRPARILDMGCTVGSSTLAWVDAYPEAEVHAIDVAAPCLRYAHARAEAMGRAVHFAQDDAEHTRYPDGHFDVVVSHILMHELSNKALRNVFKESHRLLKPGGIMAHTDGPPFKDRDSLVDRFIPDDWDTHYNAEPFITTLHQLDLTKVAVEAGFARKNVRETYCESLEAMRKDGRRNFNASQAARGDRHIVTARK